MPELLFAAGRVHPQCHASTLAMTSAGLVVAWFGGTHEKHTDVGIWVSRRQGETWSPPEQVAIGRDLAGQQVPCWNPVLFQPSNAPLLLFYKVGATIPGWSTLLRTSFDHGETWSEPRQLPSAACGPVKNKPIELADATLLCGSSLEPTWRNWQVYFSRSSDGGDTWQVTGPFTQPEKFQAIQPSLFDMSANGGNATQRLVALCRTRQGVVGRMESSDAGETWSEMTATSIPNPDSGLDGTTLSDGRMALVCNDTTKGRSRLSVLVSADGSRFEHARTLEDRDGEYSYPSVIRDGKRLYVTYTHQRTSVALTEIDEEAL